MSSAILVCIFQKEENCSSVLHLRKKSGLSCDFISGAYSALKLQNCSTSVNIVMHFICIIARKYKMNGPVNLFAKSGIFQPVVFRPLLLRDRLCSTFYGLCNRNPNTSVVTGL